MTVYGGTETVWGTKNGGFFVSCTKCGWHSEVEVRIEGEYYDVAFILMECKRCSNTAEIYGEHHYKYNENKGGK